MDRGGEVECNGSMTELLIIQTPTQKRAEILGQMKAYEAQIAHAKHDVAHVISSSLPRLNGNGPAIS